MLAVPNRLFVAAFPALFALACSSSDTRSTTPSPPAPVVPGHSIDRSAMEPAMRPGNDFFLFANGAWYAKAEIEADQVEAGNWLRVTKEAEARTKGLLEEAARAPAGSPLQKIGDYYASFLDEAAIEKRGLAPLAPSLDRITKITDKHDLAIALGATLGADVDALNVGTFVTANLFGLWVEQDFNDPSRNAAFLLQGGLLLPDRSYYLEESKEKVALRAKYERHLVTVLKLAGVGDAETKAAQVVALERKIAAAHVDRVESEDAAKANSPWPRVEFGARAPGLDWDAFFGSSHLDAVSSIIVWQPRAVAGIAALVKSEPLEAWKSFLTVHAIEDARWFLPKAFVDESFAFYLKELRGMVAPLPRWRSALRATNSALGDEVGKVYSARFFSPDSKQQIQQMVSNLVETYGRRIDALPWMTAATKVKAKEKLATLRVGIGYPDAFLDAGGLSVERGDALGNFERSQAFELRRSLAKIGQPVHRGEWVTTPQTVNAYNLPVRNELNFPAAILVPPFFDPHATAAANYGAIGAIIGHEISHSFDVEGAKFDAHGRLANWWTPEDLAHFKASAAALAAQFSTYKPLADASVDGNLTLSENIADLAGLAAAYDAWQASLGGAPAPMQDGLTGDQQFFLAYAQVWQSKFRDQEMRDSLITDAHAPGHYRVLTVRNIDAWYRAFDIAPSDSLYLAPNDRVRVW